MIQSETMSQSTKNKEFIGIIKSGAVGALAFVGICFILSIASGFAYRWMTWPFYIFLLSLSFPKTVFLVTGSIGFILGLALRRRFPAIQNGILPLIIASVLLAIALCWRSFLIEKMWRGIEQPPASIQS